MKMNLPNKLTILRVFMIPFFVIFMLLSVSGMDIEEASVSVSSFTAYRITAVAIFCIASFTDFLDGYIARKQGLVTDFGKFMDPLADKLLVCSALILLTDERSDFRMTAERFLRSMKREYGEEVSVLVSKGFRAGAELADIWTEFQQTAEMLFYGPYGQVIDPENRPVYREYQNSGIMELSRDIRVSLLSGEEGRGQAELNAYLALPEDGSVVRPDVLKEMTVNLFLQVLEGLGEFLEEEERGGLVEECLKLKGCTGYRNLKEKSSALLERIREAAGRGQLCLSPMQQAVRYIEEHYMQDLSLNTLAERYHYSPNYFSSTFKAFTGENLISYVNRLRMEKAVEYMSVQGMKNQEIAGRVGIADYKYFNKLFKRHYGMSVQEYRSRLLKERKEGNGT